MTFALTFLLLGTFILGVLLIGVFQLFCIADAAFDLASELRYMRISLLDGQHAKDTP